MRGFCLCICGGCEEQTSPALTDFIAEDNLPPRPEPTTLGGNEDVQIESELPADLGTTTTSDTDVELVPLASFENRRTRCMDALMPAISGSEELSVLNLAIEAAALEETLADQTIRATLFAPTNEAFEDLLQVLDGISVRSLFNNTDVLTALLQYHLVPGGILTKDEISRSAKLETALDDYVLIGGSNREIEGFASVGEFVGDPVQICRSMIYLIDAVLLPEGTLEELIEAFVTRAEDPPTAEEPDCREGFDGFFAISSDKDLTLFTEFLNLVQLSGLLAREVTPFTVFAPTDNAFNTTLVRLNLSVADLEADKDLLDDILRYHLIRNKNLKASELQTERLETMNGSTVFIEVDKGVEIAGIGSGASVIEADIDLSCRSAVHKIDNVLLPFRTNNEVVTSRSRRSSASSSRQGSRLGSEDDVQRGQSSCQVGNQNLYQVIGGTQNLRVWTKIIQLSGLRSSLADESISVTMFAPNDAAFGALLSPGTGFSELVPHEAIAKVLVSYHTVSGVATSRQIDPDLEVGTLLVDQRERPVEITIEDNLLIPTRLMVAAQESTANIMQTDIIGCNSVIHIVDAVLLPYEDVFPSETAPLDEAISNAEAYGSLLEEDEEEEDEEQTSRTRRGGRGRRTNAK